MAPQALIKSVGVFNQVFCGRPKVSRLKRTISLRRDRKCMVVVELFVAYCKEIPI